MAKEPFYSHESEIKKSLSLEIYFSYQMMEALEVCLPSNFTCATLLECLDYFSIAKGFYCSDMSLKYKLLYHLGIISCIILLIVLLSLVISNYMFVNLHNITDTLKVSPKFLYFIIIPLLNSFGDIINYFNGLKISTELVLGQLIGSNLIIIALTVGLICLIKPVSIIQNKRVMYDLIWLFDVLILLNYILYDGKITIWESVTMACVYLGHLLYLFKTNQFSQEEYIPMNIDEELEALERVEEQAHGTEPIWLSIVHAIVHGINFMINMVIPLDCPKAAIYYYLFIASGFIYIKFPDLITVGVVVCLSSIACFFNIKYENAHTLNILGLVNSMLVISFISQTLLMVVKNYGLILRLSDYLLGFLVFLVINSINDIITNVSLSIKYSSLVGLNACMGTPLLLILVGLGYNSLLIADTLTFTLSTNFIITARGLVVIVGVLLFAVPLRWKFSREIGVFLVLSWLALGIINCIFV